MDQLDWLSNRGQTYSYHHPSNTSYAWPDLSLHAYLRERVRAPRRVALSFPS